MILLIFFANSYIINEKQRTVMTDKTTIYYATLFLQKLAYTPSKVVDELLKLLPAEVDGVLDYAPVAAYVLVGALAASENAGAAELRNGTCPLGNFSLYL